MTQTTGVTTGVADGSQEAPESLREFYNTPGVPLASGLDRIQRMLRMLDDVFVNATGTLRILDVGCGDGAATAVTAAHAPRHEVIGLDWATSALKAAQARGVRLVRGDVSAPGLPIATASVDVVVMSEIIEHLVDTDLAVAEAYRVLRPGGTLMCSTPNLAAWFNRGLLMLGTQPVFSEVSLRAVYGRPGTQVAGHLHLFTARALAQFLRANGFTGVRLAGACYHDVPAPLRPLDRFLRRWPSLASILLAQATKPACT